MQSSSSNSNIPPVVPAAGSLKRRINNEEGKSTKKQLKEVTKELTEVRKELAEVRHEMEELKKVTQQSKGKAKGKKTSTLKIDEDSKLRVHVNTTTGDIYYNTYIFLVFFWLF